MTTISAKLASSGTYFRRLLMGERPFLVDYLLVLGTLVIVGGLTVYLRTQFFPDSAHYVGMSLWFSGWSREDAVHYVTGLSIAHGYEPNVTPAQLFDWGLVQPRVVLPAMAVPFVWIFGPEGLGVLTSLITVVMVISLYWLLRSYYGRLPAVVTVLLTLSSMFIMTFSIGMLTESLSAVWGVLTLAIAYRYQRDRRALWIVLLVVITLLSGFTRQATFIVAGAFIVAWLLSLFSESERKKWRAPALAVAGTALATQIFQTLVFPFSQAGQYMRMTNTDSLWGAILATPKLVWGLVKDEIGTFAMVDITMLTILALSFLSMIIFWKRSESHLLLGAMLGVALYNITNGTATHFRYAIPGLVFFLASISLLLKSLSVETCLNRAGTPDRVEKPTAALPRN